MATERLVTGICGASPRWRSTIDCGAIPWTSPSPARGSRGRSKTCSHRHIGHTMTVDWHAWVTPRCRVGRPTARHQAGEQVWLDALTALALFAIDPVGLGGISVRAGPGPVRDRWLTLLRLALPPASPIRRLPAHAGDDRILGGLDLTATLLAGKPVAQRRFAGRSRPRRGDPRHGRAHDARRCRPPFRRDGPGLCIRFARRPDICDRPPGLA